MKSAIIAEQFKLEKTVDYILNGVKTGRSYYLNNNDKINLVLVRLPVDTEIKEISSKVNTYDYSQADFYNKFLHDIEENTFGDRVQHILKTTVEFSQPDAIISFGANTFLPADFYEIETLFYGLDSKHCNHISPVYLNNAGKGLDHDLADIFRH